MTATTADDLVGQIRFVDQWARGAVAWYRAALRALGLQTRGAAVEAQLGPGSDACKLQTLAALLADHLLGREE